MNLWSLLLPFKWVIIGVGEVLSGIFYLLKTIVSFIGSLFIYLYEGIITLGKGIALFLVNTFKYLFLAVKWVILKLSFVFMLLFRSLGKLFILIFKGIKAFFMLLFRGLKALFVLLFKGFKALFNVIFKGLKILFIAIYKGFKALFTAIYKGLKALFTFVFKGIKFVLINAFAGVKAVIKGIALLIKYTFIYLYKVLFFIFKNAGLGFVALIEFLYRLVFVYIFKAIKVIFIYIGKALKFLFVNILYKYLAVVLKALFKGLVALLKLIGKIPIALWEVLKLIGHGLYKVFVYPFVYLYKNFGTIIKNTINKINSKIKQAITFLVSIPKKIIDAVVNWFNNLSFIKDIRNRREMKRQALLIDFDAEDAVRSEKKVVYRYVAKNADGKIEKGQLGAFSKLDVHSYLLAEGYEVYEIEPAKGLQLNIGPRTHKIGISDLVFFLTQLSTYIKSGIPLVDSIKILGKQSRKNSVKSVYKNIIYDLTMGDSFSEALEKQGNSFPRLLVNMVKSSELAGNLAETLDDMSDYYTSVSQTRKQMKSAMTYPTVILVFAVSVVIFILTFVIPSFIKMYKDADAEVPALTTAIINLSDFLVNNALWLVLGLILTILGLYFMYKNVKVFRLMVQWIMMHMPIIGKITIYNEVTMFAKTFASLWNHNVFITSSMEILSKITNNEIFKMLIFDAITNVARGEPVSASFKKHWAFPVVAYEMLLTGERTGQPGPMMEKVAQYYQEEHKNAVNQVKAFIEPALIIFLAVVVGVILLSVVLPMFSIYGQLGLETT